MEPEYSSSLTIYLSLFSLLIWLYFKFIWSASNITNLPPGPRKLPIIGNLHNLLSGSLPHHTLRNLSKKYGPLMHLQLGEGSTVVVSSPIMAQEVLKTNDVAVCGRPELLATKILAYNGTDVAFTQYGDYWRQMRKICVLELLSPKRVRSFASIREEKVSKLIESLRSSAGSVVNLTEKIYSLTSMVTARAAFGSESEDQLDAFLSLTEEAIRLAGGFELVDLYPSSKLVKLLSRTSAKLERIHKEKDVIQENIIQRHREKLAHPGGENVEAEDKDLIDVLLQLQQSGTLDIPISNDNIKALIADMFSAGSDPSSTLMEWTLSEMIKNPRVMKKAQAEIREVFRGKKTINETDIQNLDYLKLVVKETLRLHPSSPLLVPRVVREPCKIDGYDIPVNTKIIVNGWAIGRDPDFWKDAETFEPERFENSSINYNGTNFEYIPFGAGRRICPGISFALMNVEFPLAKLLYHFDWQLANGIKEENLDMTEIFGATVSRKNNLYLIPKPYAPSFEV